MLPVSTDYMVKPVNSQRPSVSRHWPRLGMTDSFVPPAQRPPEAQCHPCIAPGIPVNSLNVRYVRPSKIGNEGRTARRVPRKREQVFLVSVRHRPRPCQSSGARASTACPACTSAARHRRQPGSAFGTDRLDLYQTSAPHGPGTIEDSVSAPLPTYGDPPRSVPK